MNQTKKKRTEITIETHTLTVIRTRNGKADFGYCPDCGGNVTVFAPPHAASIFRVHEQFLKKLFEAKQIHLANEAALCGNSLVDYFG